MRLAAPRTVTIAAGPAVPGNDGVDPSASLANAVLADARLTPHAVAREDPQPPLGLALVIRIKTSAGAWRTGGTVTYRLWEREEKAGSDVLGGYVPYDTGDVTHTEGTTLPRRLTNVNPRSRFFARVTAIGGGVLATDTVDFALSVI